MAGTHAGRVNRPSPWPWLVPVAALVAGTLFASSVRASQGEDLRTDQALALTGGDTPRLVREAAGQDAEAFALLLLLHLILRENS